MATITKLCRLIDGIPRNIDASASGNIFKAYDLQATNSLLLGATGSTTALDKTGLDALIAAASASGSHIANTSNPHSVTKTQVGLGNVTDNAQVKAVGSTVVSGNFVAFSGTTGDAVSDSTYSASSFLAAAATAADSDKLDGQHGSYYAIAANYTNVTNNAQVKAVGATVVSGNFVAFSGTTGDAVSDSTYSASSFLGASATAADSDKLDGQHGSYYATSTHNHDLAYLGIAATAADSDKLDGQHGSYYATDSALSSHTGNTSNPHSVTKTQVGLSNVTNDAQLPLAGGTMTGALVLSGAPTLDLHAATKVYVDSVAQGLDIHAAVHVTTTAALDVTAAGSGVGKTLTFNTTGVQSIDGHQLALLDRVLVRNQGTPFLDNGIYTVTTLPEVGVAGILTRATDFDGSPAAEVHAGDFLFTEIGSANAGKGFVLQAVSNTNPVVDADALIFNQFSAAGAYTADGNGIELSSGTFSLELDGTSLAKSGSGLKANIDTTSIVVGAAGTLSARKTFVSLIADGSIGAGDIVIASLTDAGKCLKADADALATCEGVVGVASAAITSGDAGLIQVSGECTVAQAAAFDLGKRVYVSGVAGQGIKTAPSATNSVIFLIGVATATDKVVLQPQLIAVNE